MFDVVYDFLDFSKSNVSDGFSLNPAESSPSSTNLKMVNSSSMIVRKLSKESSVKTLATKQKFPDSMDSDSEKAAKSRIWTTSSTSSSSKPADLLPKSDSADFGGIVAMVKYLVQSLT